MSFATEGSGELFLKRYGNKITPVWKAFHKNELHDQSPNCQPSEGNTSSQTEVDPVEDNLLTSYMMKTEMKLER